MKKISLVFVLVVFAGFAMGQYKKAGYFEREGRTYNIGATAHMLGDGKRVPVGFYVGGGKDKPDKRLFRWYEFEFIPKFKYSYQTTGISSNTFQEVPVFVSGKSKNHFIYNYNVGYHFSDRSEEEPRFQPFVYLGINLILSGRADYPDYGEVYDVKKNVGTEGLNFGLRGGAGLTAKITDVLEIKTLAGYNWHYDTEKPDAPDGEIFRIYNSNFFISTGVQFRMRER